MTPPVRREYAVHEVVLFEDTDFASVADHVDDPTEDTAILVDQEVIAIHTSMRPVAQAWIGIETRSRDQLIPDDVLIEDIAINGDLDYPPSR